MALLVNDPSLQTFVRETAAADFFTALVKATGKQSLRLNQALLEEEQYVLVDMEESSRHR
jgi:archaellum component FlaG (FlaF/FlaG flagellin family)